MSVFVFSFSLCVTAGATLYEPNERCPRRVIDSASKKVCRASVRVFFVSLFKINNNNCKVKMKSEKYLFDLFVVCWLVRCYCWPVCHCARVSSHTAPCVACSSVFLLSYRYHDRFIFCTSSLSGNERRTTKQWGQFNRYQKKNNKTERNYGFELFFSGIKCARKQQQLKKCSPG